MTFLGRQLEVAGLRPIVCAPDHVHWREARAWLQAAWYEGPLSFVFRFFPAEWLPNLPRRSPWQNFVNGSATPLCNPGAALISQSKRFPLIWDDLPWPMASWRRWLPETRDPRDAPWETEEGWIIKPALGRVGDSVGIHGVTRAREWRQIRRSARWWPRHWVAQRRFDAVAFEAGPGLAVFPCFGVYTIDGKAAGIYGRVARRPLIDQEAQDVAVLRPRGVSRAGYAEDPRSPTYECTGMF